MKCNVCGKKSSMVVMTKVKWINDLCSECIWQAAEYANGKTAIYIFNLINTGVCDDLNDIIEYNNRMWKIYFDDWIIDHR